MLQQLLMLWDKAQPWVEGIEECVIVSCMHVCYDGSIKQGRSSE